MAHLYWYLRALLGTWLRDERAQDAWEYLLVIGVVVVAVILAIVTPVGQDLINQVISAVSTNVLSVLAFPEDLG